MVSNAGVRVGRQGHAVDRRKRRRRAAALKVFRTFSCPVATSWAILSDAALEELLRGPWGATIWHSGDDILSHFSPRPLNLRELPNSPSFRDVWGLSEYPQSSPEFWVSAHGNHFERQFAGAAGPRCASAQSTLTDVAELVKSARQTYASGAEQERPCRGPLASEPVFTAKPLMNTRQEKAK